MHIPRLATIKAGGQPNPVHVHFVLSDLCNLHCNFCAYRMPGYFTSQLYDKGRLNPDKLIPAAKAREILDDCAAMGVKAIQFTGGGEPTMHPDFARLFSYAQWRGLKTALVTNTYNMTDETIRALMGSTWVRISLDSGTSKTYAMVKGRMDGFNKVLDNILRLAKRRNEEKSDLYIGVGFVVTRDNWQEIPQAIEAVKETGADSIRFSAVFTSENAGYFKDFGEQANALIESGRDLEMPGFRVINTFRERFADLSDGRPEFEKCRYQHMATFIGADLNVYACCVIAYNRLGLIGSIKDQRFIKLWNSDAKKNFMDTFDARRCPRCQFLGRNRVIQKIIDQLPNGHEDFV